jgi:hypothetical protein
MAAGQSQQFSVKSANSKVTWSLSPAVGTISNSGLYTAPSVVTSQQRFTVTAKSSTGKSGQANVTLQPAQPVSVTINPASTTVAAAQTLQFTTAVAGTSNTAVTWTLSPALGIISWAGLFTAPSGITSTQSVRVTATSAADTTKTATATVTLVPSQLAITTAPLPNGTIGVPYSAMFAAIGGMTPYAWSLVSGALPAGLSLTTSSGLISGTPTMAESYTFAVQVKDASATTATGTFTVSVAASATPTFNVKNYGAQGDGATNDTAAVQAAINAAHAAGSGTVYFPSSSGCYMVTSLTFYSGLSYTGENQSVCLHSISDNAAIIATPSGSAFSDASISYLTFAGSGTVTSGYDCLELRGPTNVIIDHVTTTGCAEDGFYITGYGTNFATAGDGLLVTNSMATNSGRNGMSIIAGKNITVRDSVFQYSNRGAPFDGVDIEPNRADQVVENITFENCSFLNNGNSGSSASGHMGFNVWEAFASLPNLNLRLINNTYSGNLRDGLYAAASGYTLSGIYVIGGTMSNNQALNGYRGGVDIWNTSNVVVSNLTVTSPSQAVFLYGVNSAQIANSSLSGISVDLNTNTSTNVQVYPSTTLVHGTHAGLYTTLSGTAPVITTTSLPFGTTGAAYAELLTATGDPTITWTTLTATGNSMPSGVVLSPGGVLSGVPAASGSYTFTIQASNGITFDEKTYTLTVN